MGKLSIKIKSPYSKGPRVSASQLTVYSVLFPDNESITVVLEVLTDGTVCHESHVQLQVVVWRQS